MAKQMKEKPAQPAQKPEKSRQNSAGKGKTAQKNGAQSKKQPKTRPKK